MRRHTAAGTGKVRGTCLPMFRTFVSAGAVSRSKICERAHSAEVMRISIGRPATEASD
jgi:hypothetical protein